MRLVDLRGRAEIISWAASLGCVTVMLLADLVATGKLDPVLLGLFSGLVAATASRGQQSAAERSARDQIAQTNEEKTRANMELARRYAERAEDALHQLDERAPPRDKP